MSGPTKRVRPITGRTVLYGFIAFFGVIFAVNGVFVYFALDSWPGLSFDKAYDRGLKYNEVLAKADKQAALQWKSSLAVAPIGNGEQRVALHISGPDGQPVRDLNLKIQFSRPTHEGVDFTVGLKPATNGSYVVQHAFPAAGRWHADVLADNGAGKTYRMIHDIMIEQ